ncbi:MAG: hypothetical protein Q4G09_04605 [Clostridia bacterium]|nr:hypothetical protein [Clostridia bacterium]
MEYGYSNIRLPNDSASYIYTYNQNINTFPEEVFVHEYLHSLERILKERDYEIPNLHDYEKYGYQEERKIGLKNWYYDYMTCNVKTDDGKNVGLDPVVYTLTPPSESDFRYPVQINFSNEEKNIIEKIKGIFKVALKTFQVN